MSASTFFLPLVFAASVMSLNPHTAKQVTVYHVHRLGHTEALLNQNTADFAGRVFYDVYNMFLQYTCNVVPRPEWCADAEVDYPDQAITKLTLQVDTHFGPYSCAKGPCGPTVGLGNLSSWGAVDCKGAHPHRCLQVALGSKIGGILYFTPESGFCSDAGATGCTWRVIRTTQRISKACHTAVVTRAVEERDPQCFERCGDSDRPGACWMKCFVAAVAGPEAVAAGRPGGLAAHELLDIWARPLQDPSAGGCPPLPLGHTNLILSTGKEA